MISERQQDEASLYVLGALPEGEKTAFEAALRADPELRGLVLSLERTVEMVARALPPVSPPPELRDRVLSRALAGANPPASLAVSGAAAPAPPALSSFYYVAATDPSGWKELPIRGAFLKLLSADRERGFAVLLGRLDPGVRYPAHAHETAEDIFLLTGDLTITGRRLGPGDFHHCDAGTSHPVNYSDEGCTLLAVLSLEHNLVRFALA